MQEPGQVIPLPGRRPGINFGDAEQRLTGLLIRHALLDSFFNFRRNGKPYPFPEPAALLPNSTAPAIERPYQNVALLVLIDGTLPRALNKHFRLRASNRITWRNIRRLAPDLDLQDYKSHHCRLDAAEFDDLLVRLLPLDYALVMARPADQEGASPPFALTHLHVKVERLTDNAIKDLGKALGYIERRLFERGEDYVEALEAKFFEFYGFSANASGRKSAAAMAAQLLAAHGVRHRVFVAGQEDGRVSVLGDGDGVTQHLLLRLDGKARQALAAAAIAAGLPGPEAYLAVPSSGDSAVVIYRARLVRTAAARPVASRARDDDIQRPWLRLEAQEVLPRPGSGAPALPFAWAPRHEAG